MSLLQREPFEKLYEKHCKQGFHYAYGTAGFRYKNEVLDTVMFTTGIVACLRSIYLKSKFVGVMITASHNPAPDNGVKIVEPYGEMLDQSWEPLATDLANAASKSFQALYEKLSKMVEELRVNVEDQANLAIARDSRDSGVRLLGALKSGTEVFPDVKLVNFDMLTTPQLHFLTYALNKRQNEDLGCIDESFYYSHFISVWEKLISLYSVESLPYDLTIDCANGIGAEKVGKMLLNNDFFRESISTINYNWSQPNSLNESCGADFVKTNQTFPKDCIIKPMQLYCSFDGDADRVVFYYADTKCHFHLLDGDKIATLFAELFGKLLDECSLKDTLKLGVVQTAYANGSSTKFLSENLKVPVSCTNTGVKHLHHEAVTKYDIGVYFEANGHGTVLFSSKFKDIVDERLADTKINSTKTRKSLLSLKLLSQLINQTVGDAISDMLAVVLTLSILSLTPAEWDSRYLDLPNRLTKVIVPDRSVFKSTDAERQLVSPEGLQTKIDSLVKQYKNSRSFVRASGTEDAVRVYAEADTAEHAIELAEKVGELVKNSVQ